ncbi:MAG: hypothetical protein QF412_04805 [Planctomycetota bacterium]|nr:hypothetical protein [Planctomycetota bacterium]
MIRYLHLLPLLTLIGCSRCQPPDQVDPPPDLLLELDGMSFTRSEVEEYGRYIREEVDHRIGQLALTETVLDKVLIPMKLARRAFPEQRAQKEKHARALSTYVGNQGVAELAARGHTLGGYRPESPLTRNSLPLPVSRYVFDESNLGQVSPPIEVPQGYCVIASYDLERGLTRVSDRADVYQVPFYTHGGDDFAAWYQGAREALKGRITYAHPDVLDGLPPWLKIP